jgi:hypothetical protein
METETSASDPAVRPPSPNHCMASPLPPARFSGRRRLSRRHNVSPAQLAGRNALTNAHLCILRTSRKFCAMTNDHYLMLQTGIICILFFLVGTTTVIQHPGWFQ